MSSSEADEFIDEAPEVPAWVRHPGVAWLDDAACASLIVDGHGKVDPKAIARFFVAAGHVISPEQKAMCEKCPVRRECLIHSYIGKREKMITAGYLAGFSSGQRKASSFEELYTQVEDESARYRYDT